jgi:hypothetical protein
VLAALLTTTALLATLARLLVRLLALLVVLLAAALLLTALLVLLIGHQLAPCFRCKRSLYRHAIGASLSIRSQAARSVAEASKKAKHIFYASAHPYTEMYTAHKTGNQQPWNWNIFGTGTKSSRLLKSQHYVLFTAYVALLSLKRSGGFCLCEVC